MRFQQNCATCYISGATVDALHKKFPDNIFCDTKCPLRSRDLMPLDFFAKLRYSTCIRKS